MVSSEKSKNGIKTTRTGRRARTETPFKRRRSQTAEQRLISLLVVLMIGITALAGGVALARRSGSTATLPSSVTITVRSGDTLWSLAKTFGDHNAPILDRVDALAAANNLAGDASLSPGQRLALPVEDAAALERLEQSDRTITVTDVTAVTDTKQVAEKN